MPDRDDIDRRAEERAQELAIQAALRNERIDARFDRHDARFALINGSMERTATKLHALERSVSRLQEAIDDMAEAARLREAVERDRNRQLETASEKQISTRQFWMGVAMVIATLLAGLLVQAHLFA